VPGFFIFLKPISLEKKGNDTHQKSANLSNDHSHGGMGDARIAIISSNCEPHHFSCRSHHSFLQLFYHTHQYTGGHQFYISALSKKQILLFFSDNGVLTAVTIYILIVGLVYNIILRSQWNPKGLQLIVDNGLHTATPLLTLLYCFFYVSVKEVGWKQTPAWLIYPVLYLVYVLIRGSFSNFYPYFFINVSNLGYPIALQNAGLVSAAFLVVSFLLLWLGKMKRV
jgi:hypothetical protein